MATVIENPEEEYAQELTNEQAKIFFEAVVKRRLKIGTEEFLRRLDAGEYEGKEEDPRILKLLMLLPMIR